MSNVESMLLVHPPFRLSNKTHYTQTRLYYEVYLAGKGYLDGKQKWTFFVESPLNVSVMSNKHAPVQKYKITFFCTARSQQGYIK